MKNQVIRVNDYIRIVNPIVVDRIGYPLTPAIVKKELNIAENRQRIIDMLSDFDIPCGDKLSVYDENIPAAEVDKILDIIAYYTVRSRKFGGKNKSLYTSTFAELKDRVFRVTHKKVVKTGTYTLGETWFDEDGGYSDPNFLDNEKTHVLLGFDCNFKLYEQIYWIEKCNVELYT